MGVILRRFPEHPGQFLKVDMKKNADYYPHLKKKLSTCALIINKQKKCDRKTKERKKKPRFFKFATDGIFFVFLCNLTKVDKIAPDGQCGGPTGESS